MFQHKKTYCGLYVGNLGQIYVFLVCLATIVTAQCIYYNKILADIQSDYKIIIKIINLILFTFAVYNYVMSTFRDPGVIPAGNLSSIEANQKMKKLKQNQKYKYNPIETYEMDEILDDEPETAHQTLPKPAEDEQFQSGFSNGITDFRYCQTCKQIKQPLASHCVKCNVCVKISDHHCIFIANCVGVRNFKNFFYFLFSILLLSSLYFVNTIISLYLNKQIYLNLQNIQGLQWSNYQICLSVGLTLFALWICLISNRFRIFKIIGYLIVGLSVYYFSQKLNIKFKQFTIQWIYRPVLIFLVIFIWPVISSNFRTTLRTILINKTQRQLSRQNTDGQIPGCRQMLTNCIKFCKTKSPKSMI